MRPDCSVRNVRTVQDVTDVPGSYPVSQPTPRPDSATKVPVFKWLRDRCVAKVFLSLDLAAESSCEMTYGMNSGDFFTFCPAIWNRAGTSCRVSERG